MDGTNMDRREFLTASIGSTLPVLGWSTHAGTNRDGFSSGRTQSSPTPTSQSTPTDKVSTDPGIPIIKLVRVEPNPNGPDETNLNDEIVRLRFNIEIESYNLSGDTISYQPYGLTYEFSDFVSGKFQEYDTVAIHSGKGEPYVSESVFDVYHIYIGSTEALLDNDGGEVILSSEYGSEYATLRYPATTEIPTSTETKTKPATSMPPHTETDTPTPSRQSSPGFGPGVFGGAFASFLGGLWIWNRN